MNNKLLFAILSSTLFTLFYATMPVLNFSVGVVFIFFIIANILLLRMVYVILKQGKESSRKFEDYFYDDLKSPRLNSPKNELPAISD